MGSLRAADIEAELEGAIEQEHGMQLTRKSLSGQPRASVSSITRLPIEAAAKCLICRCSVELPDVFCSKPGSGGGLVRGIGAGADQMKLFDAERSENHASENICLKRFAAFVMLSQGENATLRHRRADRFSGGEAAIRIVIDRTRPIQFPEGRCSNLVACPAAGD